MKVLGITYNYLFLIKQNVRIFFSSQKKNVEQILCLRELSLEFYGENYVTTD